MPSWGLHRVVLALGGTPPQAPPPSLAYCLFDR